MRATLNYKMVLKCLIQLISAVKSNMYHEKTVFFHRSVLDSFVHLNNDTEKH